MQVTFLKIVVKNVITILDQGSDACSTIVNRQLYFQNKKL